MFDPEMLYVRVVDNDYVGYIYSGENSYQVVRKSDIEEIERFAKMRNLMVLKSAKNYKGYH
jgi:hypothetical protein